MKTNDNEGGGGQKIPKNLTTWFMGDPFLFLESFFTIVCKIVRHLKDVIKYRGEAIFSDLPLP